MALNTQFSNFAVNAKALAVTNAAILAGYTGLNGGTIKIYVAPQPGNANAATGLTPLVTLTFGATAFQNPPVAGLATANAITSGVATGNGNPAWARLSDASGNVILDCTAGVSGCNITVSAATISAGQNVSITSFTLQENEATSGM